MKTLSTEHRRHLERAVANAREISESGARAALEALAVDRRDPFDHMSEEQCALRRRLRAHARHLDDGMDRRSGAHGIDHLTHECACEQWHAMLFARFLAENHLLIEPEFGVPITLDECEELAKGEGTDRWTLASRFAHRMLPQVFRPDHPVFQVRFAREYRGPLEELVEGLAMEIFTASDALGWVYQFWQARKKEEVNRSEAKIGADELPAVTQLFTEPYMVQFLLHNSLGAWWESRHPDKACPVNLTYLRHTDDGQPAAGTFDGWPDDLSEFRLLDPCCGSGHFLVAALLVLVPIRMALEGLDASAAVEAVLRENLHGLEIDQRCVAIAAFAMALDAWRYPAAGGYRGLPRFNLAWCGQPVAARKEDWIRLAEGDSKVEAGMAALHEAFRYAPTLGSLIDPVRSAPEDIITAGFYEVRPLLERVLEGQDGDTEREETAIAALGIAHAAEMLTGRFHLVVTNVPYLGLGRQEGVLRRFCEYHYKDAKNDLANVFLERCIELADGGGVVQVVIPQNWLFLARYRKHRERLLRRYVWQLLAYLGAGAFATISGEVVKAVLLTIGRVSPSSTSRFSGLDVSEGTSTFEKAAILQDGKIRDLHQFDQLRNPSSRVTIEELPRLPPLEQVAVISEGLHTGDYFRFGRKHWELSELGGDWAYQQGGSTTSDYTSGLEHALLWEEGDGQLISFVQERLGTDTVSAWIKGSTVWNQRGVAVKAVGDLKGSGYTGHLFTHGIFAIVPRDSEDLAALAAFVRDPSFHEEVRKLDRKVVVARDSVAKVGFDVSLWRRKGAEDYPNGVPFPWGNDPTQWTFHGHPCGSVVWDGASKRTVTGPPRTDASALQVAVARLVGYRWPTEQDSEIELADEQREWVERCETLHRHEDKDGIVCVPSVRGERPADERLLDVIHESYGEDWAEDIPARLLNGGRGSTLDDWLRNRFFDEHCKLFHQRPFIWHVWDGRKRDGFHALVNYHRLVEGGGAGRQLLESLAFSYLGDWIVRQQDGVARGEAGSDDRLEAALQLQRRLAAIIDGEPPFDLFVRWKPLAKQPIAWNPDLNDGVRLNIRPFLADDIPGGKKGAGILRSKPNVHWRKDRGKEPLRDESDFPWFWSEGRFTGDRVNDRHYSNAEKRVARDEAQR